VNRATRRHPAPRRTYDLVLTGELVGFHVTVGAMTARDIIAVRSGSLDEGAVVALVAQRIVSHDFDISDVLDLDYWILVEILSAWGTAMEDAAVPPVIGKP